MKRFLASALVLLSVVAHTACSSDGDSPSGSGGAPASGGSSATSGGSATGGSSSTTTGGTSATGGATASGGAGVGGSDGGSAGMAGSSGSGGTTPGDPTAVAEIRGFGATANLTGSATFTQRNNAVTLVLELMNCPQGTHVAHLHENKSCANNGLGAGSHWVPNGEELGNFTCSSGGTAMHTVQRTTSVWTVGGSNSTDVTQFSLVVHAAGEPQPGDRIACGLINLVE